MCINVVLNGCASPAENKTCENHGYSSINFNKVLIMHNKTYTRQILKFSENHNRSGRFAYFADEKIFWWKIRVKNDQLNREKKILLFTCNISCFGIIVRPMIQRHFFIYFPSYFILHSFVKPQNKVVTNTFLYKLIKKLLIIAFFSSPSHSFYTFIYIL